MLSVSRLRFSVNVVAMLGMVSLSCLLPSHARSFINEDDLVNTPHQEDKSLEFSAGFTSSSLKKTNEQTSSTSPNTAEEAKTLDQEALEDNQISQLESTNSLPNSQAQDALNSSSEQTLNPNSIDSTQVQANTSSISTLTPMTSVQGVQFQSQANTVQGGLTNDSNSSNVSNSFDIQPSSSTFKSNLALVSDSATQTDTSDAPVSELNVKSTKTDGESEIEIEEFYSSHYADTLDIVNLDSQTNNLPHNLGQGLAVSSLERASQTNTVATHPLADSTNSSLKSERNADNAKSSQESLDSNDKNLSLNSNNGSVSQQSSLSTNAPLGGQVPQALSKSPQNNASKYGLLGLPYHKGNVGFGTDNLEQDPNTEQDNSIKDTISHQGDDIGVSSEDSAPLNTIEKDAFLYIPNYSANISILKQRANQGNVESQLQLAFMYASGDGVDSDLEQAFLWFTKAAEQGNVDAQFYLGVMYFEGDGINQDSQAAFKWFSLAAEQGDANAQCGLGMLYHEGQGTEQNFEQAFNWFTKSATQDNSDAQFNLGSMYEKGEFVPQDLKQAMVWFEKACELGDQDACVKANDLSAKLQDLEKELEEKESEEKAFEGNGSSEQTGSQEDLS